MTLLRLDPEGDDGDDVVTGTPSYVTAVKSGAGVVKYDAAYGMNRGTEVGIRCEAPGTADQANVQLAPSPAANTNGIIQVYFIIPTGSTPVGGSVELCGLRVGGAGANALRAFVTTGLALQWQNRAGTAIGTTVALSLNTEYCVEIEAVPGTTTGNGSGKGSIWDASPDVIDRTNDLINSQTFASANFGGDISTNIALGRVGDPNTATTSNYKIGFTQVGFDVGATMPSIAFVDKNQPAGNFPLVAVAGAWV